MKQYKKKRDDIDHYSYYTNNKEHTIQFYE